MKHLLLCLIAVCSAVVQTTGQDSGAFTAIADAQEVLKDGYIQVTFQLKNVEGRGFRSPDFNPFDVVSGPARTSSTTIVNGQVSQTQSYRYTLIAPREGTFTIPGATIEVDGRKIKSNALTIKVVPRSVSKDGQNSAREVYLEAIIDTTAVYPGQQCILQYKLFTQVDVRNYNTISIDEFEHFYYRHVNPMSRPRREVVNGMEYTTKIIKTLALFPQQAGLQTIEPLVVKAGISVKDARPRGFFFSSRTVPKTLRSNPVMIRVQPLPDNAPATFTGAVGSYQMQAQINRNTLTTDDALVLTLTIRGNGDPKRWTAPNLDAAGYFDVYEPKILEDKTAEKGGKIINTRRIEYLMIPKKTGRANFTATFTYFNPDSLRYINLDTKPISVRISPGQLHENAELQSSSMHPENAYVMEPDTDISLKKQGQVFVFSPIYWTVFALPLLFLGGVILYRRRTQKFLNLSAEERKKMQARKVARMFLQEAEEILAGSTPLNGAQTRECYEACGRALTTYILSKLKIPKADFTNENLVHKMENHGFEKSDRDAVLQHLREGERVLYAGGHGQADAFQFYERTMALITNLEKTLE